MTDREKAGLRGPVRTCIEEIIDPTGVVSLKCEYVADGRILGCRQTNPDGSEWLTIHTYDANGRVTKTVWGKSDDPDMVWLYSYDEDGSITESTNNEGKVIRTSYHRDQQGRKTAVKTFSPAVLEQYRCGVATDSFWTAAESGIGVPTGGSVATIYDDRDLPIERRILDKEGRTLTRFVRSYDANSRILEEHQELENPALSMIEKVSAEQRAEFHQEQLEQMNKAMRLMMAGKNGTGKWYKYDPQGHLIEVCDRNFAVETVTTTSYNEHGDKSEERVTRTDNLAFRAGVPYRMNENGSFPAQANPAEPSLPKLPLNSTTAQYRYEYDQHGNWTQQITLHRSGPNEHSAVRRHVLTYY